MFKTIFYFIFFSFLFPTILFLDAIEGKKLEPKDLELIATVKGSLEKMVIPGKRFVASAIRTKSGKVFVGFNLKTTATRASVCAESMALSKALETHEENCIDVIVTVAYLGDIKAETSPVVVSPCGICRELLYDYAIDANVIVPSQGNLIKTPIKQLIECPYKRS